MNILCPKWEILHGNAVNDHFKNRICQHLEDFFEEIIKETDQKIAMIGQKIDESKELQRDLQLSLGRESNIKEESTAKCLRDTYIELEENNAILKMDIESRKKRFKERIDKEKMYLAKLDEQSSFDHVSEIPKPEELKKFDDYIESLERMVNRNTQSVEKYQRDIKQLMSKLEIDRLDNEYTNLLQPPTEPSTMNVLILDSIFNSLTERYSLMEHEILNMHDRLKDSWKYIEADEEHQMEFSRLTDVSQTTYDLLLAEVNRCEEIKVKKLPTIIWILKDEIKQYQVKCLMEVNFASKDEVSSEELLKKLEIELKKLKKYYAENEEIFKLIADRESIKNLLADNKNDDPISRYKNRGGLLLKEQKEKLMNEKKLAKIEVELVKLVDVYEQQNGKEFKVYGKPVELNRSALLLTTSSNLSSLKRADSVKNLKLKASKPFQDVTNFN